MTNTATYTLDDYLADFVTDIRDKHLVKAARSLILNDSRWRDCFCEDCSAVRYIPEISRSFYGPGLPGESCCPVDGDPLDPRCARHEELFEDEAVIRDALELQEYDYPATVEESLTVGEEARL